MTIQYFKYILLLLLFASCDYKDNEVEVADHFFKVYETGESGGDFRPKAMIKDGTNMVIMAEIGGGSFKPIFLQRVDQDGAVLDTFTTNSFVNPLPKIIERNGAHYLVVTNEISLFAHLVRIDWESGDLIDVSNLGVEYPLAINETNDGYLLYSFSTLDRRSFVTYLNDDFQQSWQEEFLVFESPAELDEHLSEENELPFFTGQYNDQLLYFNGFYNQKLATVFLNESDGSFYKAIEGHRYQASTSSLYPLNDGNFFMTKYNITGENSLLESIDLRMDNTIVMNILNEEEVPQRLITGYPTRSPFRPQSLDINGTERLVVYTPTINSQAEIQIRSLDDGSLVASTRLGNGNAFFPADCLIDNDGRLWVLGQTYFANQYPRIALTRFSESEMEELK